MSDFVLPTIATRLNHETRVPNCFFYYSRWFFFSDSPRQMQFAEVNQKRKITESKKRKSLARGLSDLIWLSPWSAKQSNKTSVYDTIFLNCEPHWVQGKRILNLAEIGFFSLLVSQVWKPCTISAIKNPFVTHVNFLTFSWCEIKLFHWWPMDSWLHW